MMENNKIKKLLFEKCLEYANRRISHAKEAMHAAQQAANEEMKSSAGDKYNTERAVMQLERDKNAKQLAEALKLSKALDLISTTKHFDKVELGCLVETSNGNYFISISIGKVDVDGYTAYAISPASPLGQQLLRKVEGSQAIFNNKLISIHKII
jgi:transcription elongation GreA/GreB family factor